MGRMICIPGADFSGDNLGQATLVDNLPVEGITINGPAAAVGFATYTAKFWPVFTTDREIAWSIVEGSTYASIDAATGLLSVKSGASQNAVTIRATSTTKPSVYTDRIILCTAGTMVFKDYLKSDGTAYILIKEFRRFYGGTITVRGMLSGANGYLYCANKPNVANASTAVYLQSNGTTARARCGSASYQDMTSTGATTTRFKVVFSCSSDDTLNNGSVACYNDATGALITNVASNTRMWLDSAIALFVCGEGEVDAEFSIISGTYSSGKLYGLKLEKDNEVKANYRPALVNDIPCLYDEVSGKMYFNEAVSGLTAGND